MSVNKISSENHLFNDKWNVTTPDEDQTLQFTKIKNNDTAEKIFNSMVKDEKDNYYTKIERTSWIKKSSHIKKHY